MGASLTALTTVLAVPVECKASNSTDMSSTNGSNSIELGPEAVVGGWPEAHAGTCRTVPNSPKLRSLNLARRPFGPVHASGQTSIGSMRAEKSRDPHLLAWDGLKPVPTMVLDRNTEGLAQQTLQASPLLT